MSQRISGIFVDDGGAGSVPVVFLHSLAGNSKQWAAQLDHVRQMRRAIALDLRGHGQSAAPADGDYAIEALARDVQMVLDELDIPRCIVVGHSMGGSVALSHAGAHPQRVAGLLLVDPSGDSTQMPAADVQQYVGALESEAYVNVIEDYWSQILTGATAATRRQVMQDLHNTPRATVIGVFKELFEYNPVPALKRYDGPKLSIITPVNETPFSLHRLVSDLPHKLIEGTGHWLHLDKPEEINGILDAFISSVENRSFQ